MKSPRHKLAGLAVKNRKLADSENLLAGANSRRLRKNLEVRDVDLAKTVTLIPPSQFGKLGVDERYQRVRIGDSVNVLIVVLKNGGQVADPIDIAERPDGSWWIVDGQQRYWAHEECQLPIRANIHKVTTLEAETNLFFTLNMRRRISPRVIVKGWPGLAGALIRQANEDPRSPVWGLIDFGGNSQLPLDAVTVIKGLLAVTTGSAHSGEIATSILPRLDAALRVPGSHVWCEEFLRLVAAVFDMNKSAGRVRVLPVIALGLVAHRKFTAAGRPTFPRSCANLRRVNWDTIVPTHAQRFLDMLKSEIERRWKEAGSSSDRPHTPPLATRPPAHAQQGQLT